MKKLLLCILVCFNLSVNAQLSSSVQPITDVPTNEIYDLHVDKRGFLWVATSLGLYRYDGIKFSKFTNPHQNSISVLNILEDDKGRIWYNNYTGQIFYIQNDITHLLTTYNYERELTFPHISIFRNQFIASSMHGLFVLDLATMHSSYIKCKGDPAAGTTSMAVAKNTLMAYGKNKWMIYRPETGLIPAKVSRDMNELEENSSVLSPVAFKDTAYFISNPAAIMSKILVRGDSLVNVGELRMGSFINTVSVTPNQQWINTISASYSLSGHQKIEGESLTDVVTDREGNTWFSSSKNGLKVIYKKTLVYNVELPFVTDNDQTDNMVVTMAKYKDQLLLGTPNGKLVLYDPIEKAVTKQYVLPGNIGSINNIFHISGDTYIVGCSINTYKLNVATGVAEEMSIKALKGLTIWKDYLITASSTGLAIVPSGNLETTINDIRKHFGDGFEFDDERKLLILNRRCNAVCYYPAGKEIIVSFRDGVYSVGANGILPLRYNNERIYATSLNCIDNKVFIGVINGGLLTMSGKGFSYYSTKEGLSSSLIFKIKRINNYLWLNCSGSFQVYDLKKNEVINKYDLPSRREVVSSDVEEANGHLYLSTFKGLVMLPLKPTGVRQKFHNFLLSVKLNDTDVDDGNHVFPNQSNNIQFNVGVPVYSNSADVSIKYALITQGDTIWRVSETGQRSISFPFLVPGSYEFRAIAFNPKYGFAQKPISYSFTILPPWWQQWWFKAGVFLSLLCFLVYILATYDLRKLAFKRVLQKQAESIRSERSRISSEIHDDIGSSLFAIQLYAEVASKNREDIVEIKQISQKINEMSDKIREIIWSTNVENDNLENLLYYIQFQTSRMFEHSVIKFEVEMSDFIPEVTIDAVDRKNIYLIVKEFIHNAIKHSQATEVSLQIEVTDEQVIFVITDNGIGFDLKKLKMNSMGMHNVKNRIVKLRGNLTIETDHGTIVTIKVPIADKMERKGNWPFFS